MSHKRLMGKKLGMTHVFDEKMGKLIPCTVIKIEPNVVTDVKTLEKDGYQAVQLAAEKKRNKNRCTKPLLGHLKRAGVEEAYSRFFEFRTEDASNYELGQVLDLSIFSSGGFVDVIGTSKGKGFQGVIKRHNFAGGPASHGSGFHRAPGSTGMRSTPGRCLPGGKKPGQMGNERVTVQNLEIIDILPEDGLILVKGQIPGSKNTFVLVQEAVKKSKS